MKYNKLVRDKIVNKLLFDNQIVKYHNIDVHSQRLSHLMDKLQEERIELIEAVTNNGNVLDELVDMVEVLQAIGLHYGYSKRKLERARRRKVLRLGSFKHFYFLESVEKIDES